MSQSREIGHIQAETELKFMLLRHWTLYNSIQNSPYMVAKLRLSTEPGQQELLRFLAMTAVPLEEAKQQFAFMNPNIKRRFKERIFEVVQEFNLNDISMTSYSRQFDAKTQLSATDMAYAISALLETPLSGQAVGPTDSENQNPNRNHMMQDNEEAEKEAQAQRLDMIQGRLNDNFWIAYDALDLG